MPSPAPEPSMDYLESLASAEARGLLLPAAAQEIRRWLTQPEYESFQPALEAHVRDEAWPILQEVFWRRLPLAASGRRGVVYPLGCRAINERTVGETVEALAGYLREVYDGPPPLSCAVAFDTRPHSESFARLAAEIMVYHGFQVLFFECGRSAPQLATTVRYKQCACGIMISASRRPPWENGIKIFWSHGGLLPAPHDQAIAERIERVEAIHASHFSAAVRAAKIQFAAAEMDAVYRDHVLAEGFGMAQGNRNLRIVYSPLQGVGASCIPPVLAADGFDATLVFPPPALDQGGYFQLPDGTASLEDPQWFDRLIPYAVDQRAELILVSDADADRVGCAAPLRLGQPQWQPLNGHQIAVLLADYVLRQHQVSDTLTPQHFILKTRVTTEMLERLADAYEIRCEAACPSGFQTMGRLIDRLGADRFLLAADEAHGFLVGRHVRDKDAAVAAMLLAEAAAEAKRLGRSLHQELDRLYARYGLFLEVRASLAYPGAAGHRTLRSIMARLRQQPPQEIGGIAVRQARDFLAAPAVAADRREAAPPVSPEDLLIFDLQQDGYALAVRPSAAEDALEGFGFGYLSPEKLDDFPAQRQIAAEWLATRLAELLRP